MVASVVPATRMIGGSFLIEDQRSETLLTPEDCAAEHLRLAKMANDFADCELVPKHKQIEEGDFAVIRALIQQACAIGIAAHGPSGTRTTWNEDGIVSSLIMEQIAVSHSFSVSFGAHAGLASLPLVYFGNAVQKKKYLPKLMSGEWVSAYALSEATAGSDATNINASAVLSADGKSWILNGKKEWVTNGGFADLYVVFAKIDGERPSAFIVERKHDVRIGADEKLMGLQGCSICPITLDGCKVPVENLLGEPGRGHAIALNTLNAARVRMGAGLVGAGRHSLRQSIAYARLRNAFSRPIAEFGMIRAKIAEMAAGIFTGEAMVYRTLGLLNAALRTVDDNSSDYPAQSASAIEEFATECSIVKVWTSELLQQIVDETLQIFGAHGMTAGHPAERAYRDSRASCLLGGTNEVNRLLITGWLVRRAMFGHLALLPACKRVTESLFAGKEPALVEGTLSAERRLAANAKMAALMVAGMAAQKYAMSLTDQQEIVASIASMMMEAYAMDTVVLRTVKMIESAGQNKAQLAIAMAQVSLARSLNRMEWLARKVVAEVAQGTIQRISLEVLHRLLHCQTFNIIGLHQQIATAVLDAGGYTVRPLDRMT